LLITLQGCDASILILSTPGNQAEIEAGPNLTIHGQDLINTIKTNLEAACPGVVSCADIIALATRDVVLLVHLISFGTSLLIQLLHIHKNLTDVAKKPK
jgi:hypothetical protein